MTLRDACAAGDLGEIRRLLDGGCDIDELHDEQTPLYHACDNGQIEAARLLLHRGADVELSGKNYPPLLAACASGCYGVACLLTFVGRANVNRVSEGMRSEEYFTPLFVASVKGYPVIAKLLIDRGADVNWAKDEKNITALVMACHNGHTEVVRVLIDRGGANINAVGSNGRTPFFVACAAGCYDVVELLMKKGAITDTECDGRLPLEIAIGKGHRAVAELLRPGIMEAVEAVTAPQGTGVGVKLSELSAEHVVALAPLTAAAAKAKEAARRAR